MDTITEYFIFMILIMFYFLSVTSYLTVCCVFLSNNTCMLVIEMHD